MVCFAQQITPLHLSLICVDYERVGGWFEVRYLPIHPITPPLPPLPPHRLAQGGFLGVKRKLVMPLNILLTHTPHILTTPIVSFLLECMLRVCGFDHYFFLLSLLQPPPFVFPCNIVVKPYPILPFRSRCIVCEYCI